MLDLKVRMQGLREAADTMKKLGPLYTEGVARLLENFANDRVVTPAKEHYVPVMWGHLRDSIKASPAEVVGDQISVTVSAGDNAVRYAARVHENPRAGRTGGFSPSGKKYKNYARVGQWKYLEVPALIAARNSKEWLRREATSIIYDMQKGLK